MEWQDPLKGRYCKFKSCLSCTLGGSVDCTSVLVFSSPGYKSFAYLGFMFWFVVRINSIYLIM